MTDYRLARPVVLRLLGTVLVLAGVLVLVVALAVSLLDLPGVVLTIAVLAGAVSVVVAAVALSRRSAVFRVDETGYVVRWVRGAGVTEGRWKDVEDVVATTVEGDRCVVLRRRDGTTTTLPVGLLDTPPDTFVQELQQHLNRGHGYRTGR